MLHDPFNDMCNYDLHIQIVFTMTLYWHHIFILTNDML